MTQADLANRRDVTQGYLSTANQDIGRKLRRGPAGAVWSWI